jgi:hypothetical protein
VRRACTRGCLTADGLIETVDGPIAIATLVGKSMPVLTRLPNGRVGFRLMTKVACTATGVAIVRVTFENGHAITVDTGHVFYAPNKVERPVTELEPGEMLDTSFHFPVGYEYRRAAGSTAISDGGTHVTAIEPAGNADVFGGIVNETHSYFLTAGVLCKE